MYNADGVWGEASEPGEWTLDGVGVMLGLGGQVSSNGDRPETDSKPKTVDTTANKI